MDEMLDPVDIANVKIDLEHIGEGGNEDKVITPRYGIPFKSLPMVSRLGQEGFAAAIQKIENMGGYISAATLAELNTRVPAFNYQLARVEETGDEYRWDPNATPAAKWVATGKNYIQYLLNILSANQWLTPRKVVAGDDVNNFTKQGIYYHWGANLTSAQVLNAPLYSNGNLAFGVWIVYNPDPNGAKNPACTQTFHPYNDGYAPFHRKVSQTTNDFPATWGSIVTRATQYTYIEPLANGQDVLVLTPGRYNIASITIGNSLLNMPSMPYKFGRIEVDYSATTGYKIVRIIPYGRDTFEYVNKNYESGAWSGWKTIKDYESLKAEFDTVYATKTALASAIAEALNNITQAKYFGKQFTASELNGSALYNLSYYTGYNNVTGSGGASFNYIKANVFCLVSEPVQYRVYYGAKVTTDSRGGYVTTANIVNPDYSGLCVNFPSADMGTAQEIQLDQVISIPPNVPFVIVFRSQNLSYIRTRYFGTVTGNLESRGFNIASANNDWSTTQVSVTSPPTPPNSGYVSAGFQLLLKLPNSGGNPPIQPYVPEVFLPPKLYVMEGLEGNIFLENTMIVDHNLYDFDFTCSKGVHKRRGWRFKPVANDGLGTYSLSLGVIDKYTGLQLAVASSQVVIVSKNANSGITKKVQGIGDSRMASGAITQGILNNASTDVMGITLIGTRGIAPNLHEGRGGWTINDYTTVGRTYYLFTVSGITTAPAINATIYTFNGGEFTVQETNLSNGSGTLLCSFTGLAPTNGATGTLTKKDAAMVGDSTISFSSVQSQSGNPFWNAAASKVDYQNYLSTYNLQTPDDVFISLGVNDTFGLTSDQAAIDFCTTGFPKLDTLINSILAVNSTIRVAVCSPPTYASQDAFGYNYACGQTSKRAKRNIGIFNKLLSAYYSGKEASRIYFVGAGTNVDTENNYPESPVEVNARNPKTVIEQSNGVHSSTAGYYQESDVLTPYLKSTV